MTLFPLQHEFQQRLNKATMRRQWSTMIGIAVLSFIGTFLVNGIQIASFSIVAPPSSFLVFQLIVPLILLLGNTYGVAVAVQLTNVHDDQPAHFNPLALIMENIINVAFLSVASFFLWFVIVAAPLVLVYPLVSETFFAVLTSALIAPATLVFLVSAAKLTTVAKQYDKQLDESNLRTFFAFVKEYPLFSGAFAIICAIVFVLNSLSSLVYFIALPILLPYIAFLVQRLQKKRLTA